MAFLLADRTGYSDRVGDPAIDALGWAGEVLVVVLAVGIVSLGGGHRKEGQSVDASDRTGSDLATILARPQSASATQTQGRPDWSEAHYGSAPLRRDLV